MYIIMLGAPGSGKGTIGEELCSKFNMKHISTGDIFRNEIKNETELGKKANEYISQGKLVPDEITIAMVEEYIKDEENFLFYEPGNIDDAVNKIERLTSDKKLREKLIKNGLKTAQSREWEKIEKDIIKLYEK